MLPEWEEEIFYWQKKSEPCFWARLAKLNHLHEKSFFVKSVCCMI